MSELMVQIDYQTLLICQEALEECLDRKLVHHKQVERQQALLLLQQYATATYEMKNEDKVDYEVDPSPPEEFERMIPRYDVEENRHTEDIKYKVEFFSDVASGDVLQLGPHYKYEEDKSIQEFSAYIAGTYGEHYAGRENAVQAFDIWAACDDDPSPSHRNTAIKYLFRYGKKDGFNRKDLLKTMHYLLMLMHYHNKFHQGK